MAYRKKRAHVTIDLLEELAEECRQNFDASDATKKSKKLLDKISPIFQIIKQTKWQLYGNAMAIGRYAKKDRCKRILKLKCSTHPTVSLDGNDYFMVIQINNIRGFTRRGLKYLVAHEFAHLLQIAIDEEVYNQFSYSTDHDHDERWQKLCFAMGGNGKEYIYDEDVWC